MPTFITLRLLFIVVSALMILARPWYGDFGLALYYLGPVLLGIGVCVFRLPTAIWREALLVVVMVAMFGTMHVVFEGMAEGSFYFDGDSALVWAGVVVQVVNALISFAVATTVRELRADKTSASPDLNS